MTELHLVSWERSKMTELVIRTIHRHTSPIDFELIVLDNGSSDKTQALLKQLKDDGLIDELLLLPVNKGLEFARQELLSRTKTKYFVDIDNDCLPPNEWLPEQLELMQKYEDYAAIAQRTQVMIGSGNIFEEADLNNSDLVDFPHPGGSFRMMLTDAAKSVGGWGRDYPGRGSEERYICSKLREAGYRTGFAAQIPCLHLFGPKEVTDRWGYDKDLKPEDTGHSDIYHPALEQGDDYDLVKFYAGEERANAYFSR